MDKIEQISLVVTKDCNMGCTFCYQRTKEPNKEMDVTTVIKSMDFIQNNRTDKMLTIIWIGGEPLLNFEAIKAGVEYAKSINMNPVRHVIITNGTIWNKELDDFLKENENVKIQISWQGLPELQNETRGCSHIVEKNIVHSTSLFPGRVYIKMVITPSNVNRLFETFQYMVAFMKNPKYISVRPAFEEEGWLLQENLNTLYLEMYKIAGISLASCTNPYDLKIYRRYHCDLGHSSISVCIDGTINACHRLYFLPKGDFTIGNIDCDCTKTIDSIEEYHKDGYIKCKECPASDFCTLCPVHVYEQTDNFINPTEHSCNVMRAYAFGVQRAMVDEIIEKSKTQTDNNGNVDITKLEGLSWKQLPV
jgi:uncharacterized protein